MKIVVISDTHGLHRQLELPEADMIIHAGDESSYHNPYLNEKECRDFLDWYSKLDYKYKIFVPGNHSTAIEKGLITNLELSKMAFKYLNGKLSSSYYTLIDCENSMTIMGSPYSLEFFDWAYQFKKSEAKEYWNSIIPDNIDIVITHGPCYGILDKVKSPRPGEDSHVGDVALLNRINEVKPKFHICGHIHEGYGIHKGKHTTFINASVVNERYQLTNRPIIIEI